MDKIPYNEMLEIRDQFDHLAPGSKERTNHESAECIGDSNSMIVEKKDDGAISAYCFRCGRSGYYRGKATLKSKAFGESRSSDVNSTNGDALFGYNPGTTEVADWPGQARAWIRRSGVSDHDVKHYGINYSPDDRRILIPIYGSDGDLLQYQTRRVFEDDPRPKYIGYYRERVAVCLGNHLGGRRIVLVEDYLSGIRVSKYSPVMVLFGTKLRPDQFTFLFKFGFDEFLIWLDDDNLIVQKAQMRIKRDLDKIGKCLIYHGKGVSPKDVTDDELQRILKEQNCA